MNNDEKKEFISKSLAVQSDSYDFYPDMRKSFFDSVPKSLYKYKKIDKYIFDMIDNKYIYMATPKELDDQFECAVDVNVEEIYDPGTNNLNKDTMDMFYDVLLRFFGSCEKKEKVRRIIDSSIRGGDFNGSIILQEMMGSDVKFTNIEQRVIVNVPCAFKSFIEKEICNGSVDSVIYKALHPDMAFGIFSLAESNDNRMMWSAYADNYRGCCIEYDFSDMKYVKHMFPVIYESNYRYNIIKLIIEFAVSALVRQFSENEMPTDLSQMYSPFITKDSSFENQKEWRLLGDPQSKMPSPKIKAVYLGNNMSTENIEKMKTRAKTIGFKLYRAVIDTKKNKITFEEISL